MPATNTSTGTTTSNDRNPGDTRPAASPDSATRGEPRGAARMNSAQPESPFQWQADGAT